MKAQKVALLGLKLVSNRFSRTSELEDFKSMTWLDGDALPEKARKPKPSLVIEFRAFAKETVA